MMKKAFTLAEILIVVAILGILASLVLPTFQGHAAEARESAAKDSLRILRTTIERYAARHNGVPPGYPNDDPSEPVSSGPTFRAQVVTTEHYLSKVPKNPFNGISSVDVLGNEEAFPAEATGLHGWKYKPATKTIKLDWPGTDSEGIDYFDY